VARLHLLGPPAQMARVFFSALPLFFSALPPALLFATFGLVNSAGAEEVPVPAAVPTGHVLEEAPAIAPKSNLRSGVSTTEEPKWETAPHAAKGARAGFAVLIGLPLVILFGMYTAKSKGGFYPNGVVCALVMIGFIYFMVKSPFAYDCLKSLF